MKTSFATTCTSRITSLARLVLGTSLLAAFSLGLTGCASPGTTSATAGAEPKPLRVLFIGNSYTYVNMLPEMIRQMSLTAKERRPLEYRMIAPGGCTLEKHWSDGIAAKAIEEGRWDYVVLQEQSLRPITDSTNMHQFARLFAQEIHKAGAKTIFYVTWARQSAPAQQATITEAYSAIAKELGAVSCPVGPARAKVREKRPALELYQSDGSHPSPTGTYIGACVFYNVLYGKSPVGLPSRLIGEDNKKGATTLVDLGREEARLLQQTAAETVKEWKRATSRSPHHP